MKFLFSQIFVIDTSFKLVGAINLDQILRTKRAMKVEDVMHETQHAIPATMDQEEAARLGHRHGRRATRSRAPARRPPDRRLLAGKPMPQSRSDVAEFGLPDTTILPMVSAVVGSVLEPRGNAVRADFCPKPWLPPQLCAVVLSINH